MQKAFIPYSIAETDAHLVEELGRVLSRQGYDVEYNWNQNNPQAVYDTVAVSSFLVGIVTHPRHYKQVVQLWQYAQAQGIPAYLIIEDKMPLPQHLARHAHVHIFRRNIPANAIRFIELIFSGR